MAEQRDGRLPSYPLVATRTNLSEVRVRENLSRGIDGFLSGAGHVSEHCRRILGDRPANTALGSGSRHASEASEDELAAVRSDLDSMVGLDGVKEQFTTLTNLVRAQSERRKSGLNDSGVSMHMVFAGPPGTGKTTVARLVGRMYKALGLLSSGHVVETDRAGLVAGYVGQTAIQTDAVFERAEGGVLFVDEAYSLSSGGGQDFGREAVEVIMKRMEDRRDRVVVLFAGYQQEMDQFLISNPGLRSRISRTITFPDYQPSELLEIYARLVAEKGFVLDPPAMDAVRRLMIEAHVQRSPTFGNARYVRSVFERTIELQANRLAASSFAPELLTRLQVTDIPTYAETRSAG
jgi:replication-associated recombination protein RarA